MDASPVLIATVELGELRTHDPFAPTARRGALGLYGGRRGAQWHKLNTLVTYFGGLRAPARAGADGAAPRC